MINRPIALVIDDEPDICELISITLQRMDVACDTVSNVTEAKKRLAEQSYYLCLTDMRLPDGDGIELVEYVQRFYPNTPIAVITAFGNMELAISALKAGAFDFVSKPVNLQILRDLVNTALKLSQPSSERAHAPKRVLLGQSPQIQNLRTMIVKVARSQAPVLIIGESGTGKELVARLIHDQSPRENKPFIPVNCGAIPAELVESEFFGYRKGSFTGAQENREGLFFAAHGGTLFLDEVADLPLAMQVKLLRVIQEKAVRPIGAHSELPVDVRILSATNKPLNDLVAKGDFRQDLLYRINVIQIEVPSLRERAEDIALIAQHILDRLSHQMNLLKTPHLTDAAQKALCQYSFPGNVRELENILERAMALREKSYITESDLWLSKAEGNEKEEDISFADKAYLTRYLDNIEKETILKALQKNRWNRTETAKQLGMSLRALRYRLKKLGLDKEE